MAKVTGPLQSFRARGRFAGILDFREYPAGRVQSSRCYIQPPRCKPTGPDQTAKESAVSRCSKLWRTMTPEQQLSWEGLAFDYSNYGAEYVWRPELPPYQKFMSFNLKRCAAGLNPFKMFVPQGWLDLAMCYAMPVLSGTLAPSFAFGYCHISYSDATTGSALPAPGAGSFSYTLVPK
jgi:hypothetical protein